MRPSRRQRAVSTSDVHAFPPYFMISAVFTPRLAPPHISPDGTGSYAYGIHSWVSSDLVLLSCVHFALFCGLYHRSATVEPILEQSRWRLSNRSFGRSRKVAPPT